MKKLLIIFILVSALVLIYTITTQKNNSSVTTGDQAITLVKETFHEYKDYPSNNFPIRRVEAIDTKEGWRVGMYLEGSGLPGILKANCFLVTKSGTVTETGLFQGEGPAKTINLSACVPQE